MFKVGDRIHNMGLSSINTPITGGFPWAREDAATIVEIHPYGTKWHHMDNTGPMTYMVRYDKAEWMTDDAYQTYFNSVYPVHESRLVNVEDFGK